MQVNFDSYGIQGDWLLLGAEHKPEGSGKLIHHQSVDFQTHIMDSHKTNSPSLWKKIVGKLGLSVPVVLMMAK